MFMEIMKQNLIKQQISEGWNRMNEKFITKLIDLAHQEGPALKESTSIYESVMIKNFQIIQSFLEKINHLYNKNEDLESTVASLSEKVEKIEANIQNIHYEFRATHMMIDRKLNEIVMDCSNLNNQMRMIKHDMPIDAYLSNTTFRNETLNIKPREKRHKPDNISINEAVQRNTSYHVVVLDDQRSSSSSQNSQAQHSLAHADLKRLDHQKNINNSLSLRKSKTSNNILKDEVKNEQKINQNLNDLSLLEPKKINQRRLSIGENIIQNQNNSNDQSQRQLRKNSLKQEQIIEINNIFDSKINKFYQDNQEMNQRLKTELAFKIEESKELTFNRDEFNEKLSILKQQTQQKVENVLKMLNDEKNRFQEETSILQGQLNQKVDKQDHQNSIDNLNHIISIKFQECYQQFSNKRETKKALAWLNNKITHMIQEKQQNATNSSFKGRRQELEVQVFKYPSLKNSRLQENHHQKNESSLNNKSFCSQKSDNEKNQINSHKSLSQFQDQDLEQNFNFGENRASLPYNSINKKSKKYIVVKDDKIIDGGYHSMKRNFSTKSKRAQSGEGTPKEQKDKENNERLTRIWKEKVTTVLDTRLDKKKRKVTFK